MSEDEASESQGPLSDERLPEDTGMPLPSQSCSFNSREAFQRILSQYNGSMDLAAQAIGVEEKTLRAWICGLSSRYGDDTCKDRGNDGE